MEIQKLVKWLSCCLLIMFYLLGAPMKALASEHEIDGIAAVVNNDIITLAELNAQSAMIRERLKGQKIKLPPANVLKNQVLQMMIDQSLQKQTAKRLNISVTTGDVQKAVQTVAQQQNMTPVQLRASLKKRGISEAAFLSQLRQQILSQKLLGATVASEVSVTPQDVDAGMKIAMSQAGQNNEYHILHILIPLPEAPTPDQIAAAKEKSGRIVAELQAGASFKTVAAAESGGAMMFTGGDMGWRTLAQLPATFSNQIINMKQGQIAGPIQSANGFHIIKLEGIRGNTAQINQNQLRQQVAQMIYQRKIQEKQQQWIEQLRSSAYIKIDYKPQGLPTPLS